jgi:hypothetical protein
MLYYTKLMDTGVDTLTFFIEGKILTAYCEKSVPKWASKFVGKFVHVELENNHVISFHGRMYK